MGCFGRRRGLAPVFLVLARRADGVGLLSEWRLGLSDGIAGAGSRARIDWLLGPRVISYTAEIKWFILVRRGGLECFNLVQRLPIARLSTVRVGATKGPEQHECVW